MAQEGKEGSSMRTSGWIFFMISWSFIICLTAFCFYKVLTKKKMD